MVICTTKGLAEYAGRICRMPLVIQIVIENLKEWSLTMPTVNSDLSRKQETKNLAELLMNVKVDAYVKGEDNWSVYRYILSKVGRRGCMER